MHLHLRIEKLITCTKCGKLVLPHTVCANCGFYRGKEMIDVLAKLTKKERKIKEREMAKQEGNAKGELSAQELSKSN